MTKKWIPPAPNKEQLAGITAYHEGQKAIREMILKKYADKQYQLLHPKERKKILSKNDKVILERLHKMKEDE